MVHIVTEQPTCSFVVSILSYIYSKKGGGGKQYPVCLLCYPLLHFLDLGRMSRLLQSKMVESVVKQKFGDLSLRIFRLLSIKKQLEQKQVCITLFFFPIKVANVNSYSPSPFQNTKIAELALMQLKDTRERLYEMFTAGYVVLQVFPPTLFYTWIWY